MKTSILVSSIAALSLLITFAESPKRQSADNNSTALASNYYYIPSNFVFEDPSSKLSANTKQYSDIKSKVKYNEDFTYLKFNVTNYSDNEESATGGTDENSFDYLKFDVNNYSGNNELTNPDAIELPVNELPNLKFDVNEYTGNRDLTSFETFEMPASEFDYLKFDVNHYNTEDMNSDEITELPVDEYSYLKFDINNYCSPNSTCTDTIGELPVHE